VHVWNADTRSGTAGHGMMGSGMMGQSMMGGMTQSGMTGGMPMMGRRGPMMKMMFAVADADGDGALSFDEVATIHRRIFNRVDTSKDGKVTVEEVQAFMR
jgi:EF-hand domain/EF-hand domain pair